ncbi:hypothetical protein ACJZ2D_008525 [Fusarium nematophilum]
MSPRQVDIFCYASGPALPGFSRGPGAGTAIDGPCRGKSHAIAADKHHDVHPAVGEESAPFLPKRTPPPLVRCVSLCKREKSLPHCPGYGRENIDNGPNTSTTSHGLWLSSVPNVLAVPKSKSKGHPSIDSQIRQSGLPPPLQASASAAGKKFNGGEYDDTQKRQIRVFLDLFCPIVSCLVVLSPIPSSLRLDSQLPVPAQPGPGLLNQRIGSRIRPLVLSTDASLPVETSPKTCKSKHPLPRPKSESKLADLIKSTANPPPILRPGPVRPGHQRRLRRPISRPPHLASPAGSSLSLSGLVCSVKALWIWPQSRRHPHLAISPVSPLASLPSLLGSPIWSPANCLPSSIGSPAERSSASSHCFCEAVTTTAALIFHLHRPPATSALTHQPARHPPTPSRRLCDCPESLPNGLAALLNSIDSRSSAIPSPTPSPRIDPA